MDSRRLLQLAGDLRADREDLERILQEGARCLRDLAAREPSYLELRGAGDIVHDFYNVVEHFFERVAVEMNGGLPAGPDSHAQLLRRMSREVESVRPAVVDEAVRTRLHEYLRFRHLFRHGYGFALEWPRLVPLLEGMQGLAPDLRRQLDAFVAAVEALARRLE
jgi:AcrR family transcriptional regulator